MTGRKEFVAARSRLLRLLGFRLRSRREAELALRREGFTAPSIEAALEEMQSLGYIDDARFCTEYIRSRHNRGYGPHRIRLELMQKGVDGELLDKKLTEFYRGPVEAERARALVLKKLPPGYAPDNHVLRRRCAALLQRRGFAEALIRRILQEYFP